MNLTFTHCGSETFTAINPQKIYYVQRNSPTSPTAFVLSFDVVTDLFYGPPIEPLCAIKEWYMSLPTSTTKLLTSDPLAIKFNQDSRSLNAFLDTLNVNTVEPPSEKTDTYDFSIQVLLRGDSTQTYLKVLHHEKANIRVKIGCFYLSSLTIQQVTDPQTLNFKSFVAGSPSVLTVKMGI